MGRIGWTALAVAALASGPVQATSLFDFTITGHTQTGDAYSAYVDYDLRPAGCCGVYGYPAQYELDTSLNEAFNSSFALTVNNQTYSYLLGRSFSLAASHLLYEEYDRVDFLSIQAAGDGASLDFFNESFDGPLVPDRNFSGTGPYSIPVSIYNRFTAAIPSSDGLSQIDLALSIDSITLTFPQPVPLPASLPLFAGAVLALGALTYRHRLRSVP